MKKILLTLRYIRHVLKSRNTRGHGVHSPFLYSFVQMMYDKNPFYVFASIEDIRQKLQKDDRRIKIKDFGTGNKKTSSVSRIAKNSLKSKKWAQLLFRVVNFSKAKNVLELGTSLGITTAYLASADSGIRCVTLEGAPETAKIARENFESLHCENIELVEGNIDNTLPVALSKLKKLDFAFFDANHRKIPTLKYFHECLPFTDENSIFVFDDIYWSKDMQQAWKEIKKSPKITATIDLFELGIVFFNKNLPKRNFRIKL